METLNAFSDWCESMQDYIPVLWVFTIGFFLLMQIEHGIAMAVMSFFNRGRRDLAEIFLAVGEELGFGSGEFILRLPAIKAEERRLSFWDRLAVELYLHIGLGVHRHPSDPALAGVTAYDIDRRRLFKDAA
jgi:hypothetical protein